MEKAINKLKNFSDANMRLREAVIGYKGNSKDTLYRDGLIQRFEFTFELAWKTAAEILREQGVLLEIISPKTVFQAAYQAGFVNNEEIWLNILEDRNMTSHIYDESIAAEIADKICIRYSKELTELYNSLSRYSSNR